MWKQFKDTNYLISDLGEVKNSLTDLILKHTVGRYSKVRIYADGDVKTKMVHRLVAETFLPNPENKPQINHIDGNRQNNCLSNLEWCNQSENQLHAFRLGLQVSKKGEDNHLSRLLAEEVLIIKELLETNEFSGPDIAKLFGVQPQLISKINRGRRWSEVTGWTPENRADVVVDYGNFIRKSISKLSVEDIPKIRGLFATHSDTEIGKIYGVHKGTINQIRRGKTWINY